MLTTITTSQLASQQNVDHDTFQIWDVEILASGDSLAYTEYIRDSLIILYFWGAPMELQKFESESRLTPRYRKRNLTPSLLLLEESNPNLIFQGLEQNNVTHIIKQMLKISYFCSYIYPLCLHNGEGQCKRVYGFQAKKITVIH